MSEFGMLSVVVPTIGRSELLAACLDSILACEPPPDEVLVVDQSRDNAVRDLIGRIGPPVRHVPCTGRGIARGINLGLRTAVGDMVCVTNDDCTVATDWVGAARAAMQVRPDGIATGMVLPAGDPDGTPSTKTDPEPHDFTGEAPKWVLYGGNMVLPRLAALDIGAFDEREGLLTAAEDNDFCYRWMSAGRPLRYDPSLVVWHHDWRTPRELARRYRTYARGQGVFYAKHLHAGDTAIRTAVRDDLRRGLRANVAAVVRGRWRQPDEARALLVGVPVGIMRGWLEARRLSASDRHRPGL
jgi:GT2 family glycosyltransferase